MSAIFISHSSRDNAVAAEVRTWLAEQGHHSVFLDFDPAEGIPAGRYWEQEIYAQMRSCQAVIVLCSEPAMASPWCFAEITHARSLGKHLFPLKVAPCAIPAFLHDVQLIDLTAERATGYERLGVGLRKAGLDPADLFTWDGRRPPYPGLEALQEQDAPVYFGRDAAIQGALETLHRLQRFGGTRLTLVLGASGSGKSSLVRAGILPRLKRDAQRWLVLEPFRPSGDPWEAWALALDSTFQRYGTSRDWQAMRDRFRHAADDVSAFVHDIANDLRVAAGQREATLLLTIDQVEELFNPSGATAAHHFLRVLRLLLDETGSPWLVLGTMRSDFLSAWQTHEVVRALAYEPILLPQMALGDFAQVIEGPARVAGLALEPGLVQHMLVDTATADALPLLAFTLRALWERCGRDKQLTITEYREGLGGLQGSVARAADMVYGHRARTAEQESHLRQAFLGMVRVNEEGRYVRTPARWADLPVDIHDVLEQFVRERLLVARSEGTERVLEVAHETLFRSWDRLAAWINDDRAFLLWRQRLRTALADWERTQHDAGVLLRGGPLAEARHWLEERSGDLSAAERGLIQASVASEEREQAERERRRRRRIQVVLGVALLFFMLSGLAVVLWQLAEAQRQIAEQERNQALQTESRRLADKSREQTAAGDATSGILLALEALPKNLSKPQRPYVAEAEAALHYALRTPRAIAVLERHTGPVRHLAFSPHGQRLVSASSDGTARLWDPARHVEAAVLKEHKGAVHSATFSPDGLRLITASEDGTARLWNTSDGARIAVFSGHAGPVEHAAFSPDGRYLVTASRDHTACVWSVDGRTAPVVLRGHTGVVGHVVFSPDGHRLATASSDQTARLWNAASGAEMAVLHGHQDGVRRVAFSPRGDRLLTASSDETLRLWDASHGTEVAVLRGHTRPVTHAAYSPDPDGRLIVSTSEDGTVRLWDASHGTEIRSLRGHTGWVEHAAFSSDGHRLVTASKDRTARLWDVTYGVEIAVLGGHQEAVEQATFSPDNRYIATAVHDGTIRLWDTTHSNETAILRGHTGAVRQAIFNADGQHLVTASSDHTVRLWETNTGSMVAVLPEGHADVVWGVDFHAAISRIASASSDGTVRLWDAASRTRVATLSRHQGAVTHVSFSPNGQYLASASEDGTARLWDGRTGTEAALLSGHKGWVTWVAFNRTGDRVVTTSSDGTARLWEVPSGTERAVLRGHTGALRQAAFHPHGSQVITASEDGTARLWEVASGAEVAVLQGHKGALTQVTFSPGSDSAGRRVFTAAEDGTARLWDAPSATQIAVFYTGAEVVWHAAFSPDGHHVVTALSDGTAHMFRIFPNTQAMIDEAVRLGLSPLSQKQRKKYFLSAE